jgi:hypothetical protein
MTERTAGTSLQYVLPYLQTTVGFEPTDSLCRLRDLHSRSHSYSLCYSLVFRLQPRNTLHNIALESNQRLTIMAEGSLRTNRNVIERRTRLPKMLKANLNPRHSVHAEPYAAKGDVSLDLIFCLHWAVNPMGFGQDFKHLCRPRPYHLRFDHCYAQAFP